MSKEIRSPNCAYCKVRSCYRDPNAVKLNFCPMTLYPDIVKEALTKYNDSKVKEIHRVASLVEKEGYASGLG